MLKMLELLKNQIEKLSLGGAIQHLMSGVSQMAHSLSVVVS